MGTEPNGWGRATFFFSRQAVHKYGKSFGVYAGFLEVFNGFAIGLGFQLAIKGSGGEHTGQIMNS